MKKMSKAERIYNDAIVECRIHIKNWGYDGYGFSNISNEPIYARTAGAIRKLIARDRKQTEFMEKYGTWTAEKIKLRLNAIDMVEKSLDNTYIF